MPKSKPTPMEEVVLADVEVAVTTTECPKGHIKVLSYYRSFPDIGVGHTLTITPTSGEAETHEVELPVGESVDKTYGPYTAGPATVVLTPTLNHNKQNSEGGTTWEKQVTVPAGGEVEVRFQFVETDTWDSRYTTNRIGNLHPDHQQRFLVFINKVEEDSDHQFRVADGFRTPAQQDALYCNSRATAQYCVDLGLTSGNGAWKSNAKKWKSYHNYGLAVDIYRFGDQNQLINPDTSTDTVGQAVDLNWGNSFGDPPHFEWNEHSVSALKKMIDDGHTQTSNGNTYVDFDAAAAAENE